MKTIAVVAFILHVVFFWARRHDVAAMYLIAATIAAAAT